jgi:hypothetical protein
MKQALCCQLLSIGNIGALRRDLPHLESYLQLDNQKVQAES